MFTDMKYVDLWYLKTSFSSFRGKGDLGNREGFPSCQHTMGHK